MSRAEGGAVDAGAIVRDLIRHFEAAFPGGVRACYLVGSRAEGGAASVSDIDGVLVLAGEPGDDARRRAAELLDACRRRSPIRLDFAVFGERDAELARSPDVRIKLGGRLVHGEDLRDSWPLPSLDAHRCYITTWPLEFLAVLHDAQRVVHPLRHPEPEGEFFGYERKRAVRWYPPHVATGTKELVATICWTATARIALDAGAFAPSRSECVRLYRERIGDEWTDLVEDAYHRCKLDWDYAVPPEPAARARLRALCARAPDFFNHYLERYRRYLLDALGDAETARPLLGRLPDALYADRSLDEALERLAARGDPELARLARGAAARLAGWRAEEGGG